MNSLPFSLSSQTPTKLTKPIAPLLRNLHTTEPLAIKISNHQSSSNSPMLLQLNEENSALLKRREAIGLGLSLGFLDILLQPQSSAAAEVASPPCELTVTPSGLSFCDKVVGSGAEAVKGQLIKVSQLLHLEILRVRFHYVSLCLLEKLEND